MARVRRSERRGHWFKSSHPDINQSLQQKTGMIKAMKKSAPVCPISLVHVDEHVVRLNGLASILLLLGGIYIPIIWLFLAFDFLMRSFSKKYSLVAQINRRIVNLFKVEPKPIDAAPKKFAAQMGLSMMILLNLTSFAGYNQLARIVFIALIIAISLETFFRYCLGCQIYSIIQRFR